MGLFAYLETLESTRCFLSLGLPADGLSDQETEQRLLWKESRSHSTPVPPERWGMDASVQQGHHVSQINRNGHPTAEIQASLSRPVTKKTKEKTLHNTVLVGSEQSLNYGSAVLSSPHTGLKNPTPPVLLTWEFHFPEKPK